MTDFSHSVKQIFDIMNMAPGRVTIVDGKVVYEAKQRKLSSRVTTW